MATAFSTARHPQVPIRRKALALPLILMLSVGASWWAWSKTHAADDLSKNLLTAAVTRGDLIETVSATGSITAQTGAEVKIGSQITGRIKKLNADVGSSVRAGEVIAELDLPDVQAQLDQARYNWEATRTKLEQQRSGVNMEQTQTGSAVTQAQEQIHSAQSRLDSAIASARQQTVQTPADIRRAETSLAAMQAALSTAKSNLTQVQAGANLQIATAQEQSKQAQANALNSSVNLKRLQTLLAKGFVAAGDVDTAKAQAVVNQSQVNAAQQNVELVRQKVTADLESAQDQVIQAQQNVASAGAALESARAEVNLDAVKLADVNDAQSQLDQAETGLKVAEGNGAQDVLKQQDVLQAVEAERAAQEQVAYNRAQVEKTSIRSPISGTVLQLAAQQGETLAAGLSAPTLIVVADLNRLQVDAFVDETDIGKVRLGQNAAVTVDAFPKRVFKGKVSKIASGSTIQQGVITYDVTLAIENLEHRLKPDMTASVTIQTGKRSDVLLVPSEAVKTGRSGITVNVLAATNGKTAIVPRKVKTGGSDGVNTEIREGLQENETVVLAGMDKSRRPAGGASPFGAGGGGRMR